MAHGRQLTHSSSGSASAPRSQVPRRACVTEIVTTSACIDDSPEARVALRLLLERYRDIEVAADEPVEQRNPWTMVAVSRLPLEVRAA